jgi:hypothetical protein
MTIDQCVAHAISSDFDLRTAWPEVDAVPIEQLEAVIADYIDSLQERLTEAVRLGEHHLQEADTAGLCEHLVAHQIALPLPMLLAMSRTIVELWHDDLEPCCVPVYFMRLTLSPPVRG